MSDQNLSSKFGTDKTPGGKTGVDKNNTSKPVKKPTITITNICTFPKIDSFPDNTQSDKNITMKYIGHFGRINHLLKISSNSFKNHWVSLGDDEQVKIWDLAHNKLVKSIRYNFVSYNMFYDSTSESVILCGEGIIKLNLNTEKTEYTIRSKIGPFREFYYACKVSNTTAVATCCNNYYLVFNFQTGNVIRKIHMNEVHFLCDLKNIIKNQNSFSTQKKSKKDQDNQDISDEENKKEINKVLSNINSNNTNQLNGNHSNNKNASEHNEEEESKEAEEWRKQRLEYMAQHTGRIKSAKCMVTKTGHSRLVYNMIPVNHAEFPMSVWSGGEDDIVKLIKVEEDHPEAIDFVGHEDTITSLSRFGANCFLSGSIDRTVRKWNLLSRQCEEVLHGHTSIIWVWNEINSAYFMSVGMDRKIKIWKNESEHCSKTYIYDNAWIMASCKVDKNVFAFGDSKGEIIVKRINDI